MSRSARGLFRATGNVARPVMSDLINGEAVYQAESPREVDDFYPTPPEPIRGLLRVEAPYLDHSLPIWEPAAGDGAMVHEMRKAGYHVYASDLIDRGCDAQIQSFYDFNTAPSRQAITNPPFNECNTGDWIRHAFEVLDLDYMALLLPMGWPGAESRASLWAKHPPARVYLMRWRIDFTGAGAPPMLNAWFVWDRRKQVGETQLHMLSRSDASLTGDLF